MQLPVLFLLAGIKARTSASRLGMGPFTAAQAPLPAITFLISGITKDSLGVVLGSCTVKLYRTVDDTLLETQVSDPTTGAYVFSTCSASFTYYVVAYKAGSPDVAGTTVNTLVGV